MEKTARICNFHPLIPSAWQAGGLPGRRQQFDPWIPASASQPSQICVYFPKEFRHIVTLIKRPLIVTVAEPKGQEGMAMK